VLEIDLISGRIENLTQKKVFSAAPYPDFIRELIDAGGLVPYARKKIGEGK
jgi:3-isopropylmalate/(R)-2-methylmalate dehydratase small subunit